MELQTLFFLKIGFFMLKFCDCSTPSFVRKAIDDAYEIGKTGFGGTLGNTYILKERSEDFLLKVFGHVSQLIPTTMEIPKTIENVGSSTIRCTSEATISLHIGEVMTGTNVKKDTSAKGGGYNLITFMVGVEIQNPVTFQMFEKDSNSQDTENICEYTAASDTVTYTFSHTSQLKISLGIPDFSKKKHDLPRDCPVSINDLTIESLGEPEVTNGPENKHPNIGEEFWNSMKEQDFPEIIKSGIIQGLLDEGSEMEKPEYEWVCLSEAFTRRCIKEYYSDDNGGGDNGSQGTTEATTYKKVDPDPIIDAFQYGIVKMVTTKTEIGEDDYLVKKKEFIIDPTSGTPVRFTLYVYAPNIFARLRQMFGLDKNSFLNGEGNKLVPIKNPGKSKASIYFTQNKVYFGKTLEDSEVQVLQTLLPSYFKTMEENSFSLLPKLAGLWTFTKGVSLIMLVSNNLMPNKVRIDQKYDLKGSLFDRNASEEEKKKEKPTFKDNDFLEHHKHGIYINGEDYDLIMGAIERDSNILKESNIVDYSLLLGIHYEEQPDQSKPVEENPSGEIASLLPCQEKGASSGTIAKINSKGNFLPFALPAMTPSGKKLQLYFGIIDTLQAYNTKKKLANFYKKHFKARGQSFSMVPPGEYAPRFQDFMRDRVFKKIRICPESVTGSKSASLSGTTEAPSNKQRLGRWMSSLGQRSPSAKHSS